MHTIFLVPFWLQYDIVLKLYVAMHLTELFTEPYLLLAKQVL